MHDWESLSHVRWDCKYHVVIVPKYRRRALYGEFSPPGCPRPDKCAQQTKCSRTPWWIGRASKRSPVALVVSPIVRKPLRVRAAWRWRRVTAGILRPASGSGILP